MRADELRGLTGEADERSRLAAMAFRRTAEEAGLVDVAYGFADSPFGQLLVAVTPRGVVALAYPDEDVDTELDRLSAHVSPRVVESPTATDQVRRQLGEYFDGRRQAFAVTVDLSPIRGFRRRVLETTARIPYGRLITYREAAAGAGNARATRAAGNALGSNPIPIIVPCHRVVRTGGGLGGYTGGLDRKIALLRLEGALPDPPSGAR